MFSSNKEDKPVVIEGKKEEIKVETAEKDYFKNGKDLGNWDLAVSNYKENAEEYLRKINIFREKCGIPMINTSFLREKADQIKIYKEKAAKKEFPFDKTSKFGEGVYDESLVPLSSKHFYAQAGDFSDREKKIAKWVLDNLDWCIENKYYFENFGYNLTTKKREYDEKADKTKTWIHIQIVPPGSGNTIFNP